MRETGFGGSWFALLHWESFGGEIESIEELIDEFVVAPIVEEVFEPGFVSVGSIAVVDEDTEDGVGDGDALFGFEEQADVFGEVFVAGDSTEL